MDETTRVRQKIGFQLPVLESAWVQRNADDLEWWAGAAEASMARIATDIAGFEGPEVLVESEIDGLRLFGHDEEGNELPRYVMLRYTAFAVPLEGG